MKNMKFIVILTTKNNYGQENYAHKLFTKVIQYNRIDKVTLKSFNRKLILI